VDTNAGIKQFDKNGELITDYALFKPVWVDPDHFAAVSSRAGSQAVLVDVATGEREDIDVPFTYGGVIASGNGAIAIARPGQGALEEKVWEFVVWSSEGVSDRHEGFPVAWSPDGSSFVVLHGRVDQMGVQGWPEVFSWPSLASRFEDPSPIDIGDADFDPDGSHLAYDIHTGEGEDLQVFVRIVSLETSVSVDVPRDLRPTHYWNSDGTLSIIRDDGMLRTYDLAGKLIATVRAPARAGAGSEDGSTVVFWADNPTEVHVQRNGFVTTYGLPGGSSNRFELIALSPDGSVLTVTEVAYDTLMLQL
jgi:hypothetical protein